MHAADDMRIPVGISACLIGETVRYDGGHKRHRHIHEILGRYFRYLPVCPEVAIGLGVPRPPIHLVGRPGAPRAVEVDRPQRDSTDALAAYGREQADALSGRISGYILKANSPSCGMDGVKVHDETGEPMGTGRGIYADALIRRHPVLPVEEEGRLDDPVLRGNFVERVHVFDRWRRLWAGGLNAGSLVEFHSRHKYLLMAYDQAAYRRLGRMVAEAGGLDIDALAEPYLRELMAALRRPPTRRDHANALQHMAGHFKRRLPVDERRALDGSIHAYRRGEHPLQVPLTLIRQYLQHHPDPYLESQHYLDLTLRDATSEH